MNVQLVRDAEVTVLGCTKVQEILFCAKCNISRQNDQKQPILLAH